MMAIDPVTIAVAAAMMDINKKLDAIQEAEKSAIRIHELHEKYLLDAKSVFTYVYFI